MAAVCACGQEAGPHDVECTLCGRTLEPQAPAYVTPPIPPSSGPPATPPRGTAGWSPAVVVIGALVLCLVVGLVVLLFVRPGPPTTATGQDPSSVARGGQSSVSETQPADPTPLPEDAPSSDEPSEPLPSEEVDLPPGAVGCPQVFDDSSAPLQHSARGNDVTTCPFAENVRRAYLEEDLLGEAVEVRAYSPVTKKSYRMTCDGTTLVRCTGGNDAVVLIY